MEDNKINPMFYWEEFDEPKIAMNFVTKKEYLIHGEYKCTHPLVEKGWATGCMRQDDMIPQLMSHLIMVNGDRYDFIEEAPNYIKVNNFLNNL